MQELSETVFPTSQLFISKESFVKAKQLSLSIGQRLGFRIAESEELLCSRGQTCL